MKKALFFKSLKEKDIQCELCPQFCVIKNNEVGICNVRKNIDGILYSLSYGKPVAVHIDPIEKKPLYHFYPGKNVFSIGTIGCNLKCKNCQNADISQGNPEKFKIREFSPKDIIELVKTNKCDIIAYTYTEPTIFYEYMLDIAKLAKKERIKNVIVSNGFINEKPLNELCKYISAANIDLKSFNENFYKDICSAKLKPVLNSLKILKKNKVWIELTNLVIPKKNDNLNEIEKMCKWIRENLGKDTPIHFSKFYPMYKMKDPKETPIQTLKEVYKIAKKYLDFVYIGNVNLEENNTFCPKCNELIIKREGFEIIKNIIIKNKCKFCKNKISGIF